MGETDWIQYKENEKVPKEKLYGIELESETDSEPEEFSDAPYDTAKAQQGTRWTIATSSTEWTYSIAIDSIDRTDPRNMKIIQCPYCPIEIE